MAAANRWAQTLRQQLKLEHGNGWTVEEQSEKVKLVLRDDSISPGVDGCVVGHLTLLHDYAEFQACELINQVLAAGET